MSKPRVNQPIPRPVSLTEVVAELASLEVTPSSFLAQVLATQCQVTAAEGGALLQIEKSAVSRILEVCPAIPPGARRPAWLDHALTLAPSVTERGQPLVQRLDDGATAPGADPAGVLVLVPVRTAPRRWCVGAYHLGARDDAGATIALERLQMTAGLLRLRDLHLKIRARDHLIVALRRATETLEAVNEQDRFTAAAIALCDEVAARWDAERVSIGFLDGRYVKVAALSHTERFDRKMALIRDLEAAMEECLDQDVELIHPRPESAVYVSRASEQLARRHGPMSVACLPLRRKGEIAGVLAVERPLETPLEPSDVEILRVTCELIGPRLIELRRSDRWVGARAASALREAAAAVVGPKHTGKKLLALVFTAALLFLVLATGEDRVHTSFEVTASVQVVVPAPFDGRIERVDVEPGQIARAGETVLATLETDDLRLERVSLLAERSALLREADLALRDRQTVQMQIAEANLRRIDAEIDLLDRRIAQARIVAPIDGTVVVGDLKRRVGSPVESGAVLFEIAEVLDLRAELRIPEDRISEIVRLQAGETVRGTLASVSHPGEFIPFAVERIHPIAELIDGQNVFRVDVRLLELRPWLRPGMKGVAKVGVGRKSYGSLLTRQLVTRIRMWLWI